MRSRRQIQEGEDVCVPMADSGIWQKLTEYCKAIILQLKINNFFKKLRSWHLVPLLEIHILIYSSDHDLTPKLRKFK